MVDLFEVSQALGHWVKNLSRTNDQKILKFIIIKLVFSVEQIWAWGLSELFVLKHSSKPSDVCLRSQKTLTADFAIFIPDEETLILSSLVWFE